MNDIMIAALRKKRMGDYGSPSDSASEPKDSSAPMDMESCMKDISDKLDKILAIISPEEENEPQDQNEVPVKA